MSTLEKQEDHTPGPDAVWWYVTMTWEDWPEGGSYGDVVLADTDEDAIRIVRQDMAALSRDDYNDYNDWHVVDCFPLADAVRVWVERGFLGETGDARASD